jgi:hypothetical protein
MIHRRSDNWRKPIRPLLLVSVGLALAACSSTPKVNSEPQYTTQYELDAVEFRGVPISKYTGAKRRHLFIYHFDVPPGVIFDDAARLTDFAPVRWDDRGTGIEVPGKGTIRWVEVAKREVREEIMEYDPPHMLFYQIDPEQSTFKFRLKNHIAAVTVEPDGAEGSIVTWRIYYDYVARPLTVLKKPIFNKAIPDGLDGLVKIHGGTRLEAVDASAD